MPYVHYIEARDKCYEQLAASEKAEWFSTVEWDVRVMYSSKAFRRTYSTFFVDPKAEDFEEEVAHILARGEPFWILGNGAEISEEKVKTTHVPEVTTF